MPLLLEALGDMLLHDGLRRRASMYTPRPPQVSLVPSVPSVTAASDSSTSFGCDRPSSIRMWRLAVMISKTHLRSAVSSGAFFARDRSLIWSTKLWSVDVSEATPVVVRTPRNGRQRVTDRKFLSCALRLTRASEGSTPHR